LLSFVSGIFSFPHQAEVSLIIWALVLILLGNNHLFITSVELPGVAHVHQTLICVAVHNAIVAVFPWPS